MPVIVSIVGKSSTGKTTFLEKLLRELTARGNKVATIKHSHHSLSFDDPSKDSYRHAQAGAAATMVSSTTSFQIIKAVPQELSIEELARNLGEEYDLILTEGFSRGNMPKIEIHRKEAGPLLETATRLFAVVTDEPLETEARQFGFEDVKGVADLLEEKYIRPNQERFTLYVEGENLPASALPRQAIEDFLAAVNKTLKGDREITDLEFRYYKRRNRGEAKEKMAA
ncbi:MAG: molybdopterin-guanine dinucleotide biosynthesis protein [Chloroflexi bacterium]|nr:molybdopterin-guanine dinucleotide biosynthesis protein [Chloroflexota bacterium]